MAGNVIIINTAAPVPGQFHFFRILDEEGEYCQWKQIIKELKC